MINETDAKKNSVYALNPEDPPRSALKSFMFELAESFISSMLVLFLLYKFIAMPEVVRGASMSPNFEDNERILMERVTRHIKPFERGEVVILHPPENSHIDYIKRIIGIPGDIVKIKDCQVYINRDGQKFVLEESYLLKDTCTMDGPRLREGRSLRLKEGEFAVMGDNRTNSLDSRVFGVVKEKDVIGKVIFRFWPFDRLGFL